MEINLELFLEIERFWWNYLHLESEIRTANTTALGDRPILLTRLRQAQPDNVAGNRRARAGFRTQSGLFPQVLSWPG